MRLVRRILAPLTQALAWLLLFGSLTCLVLERTGWISDSIRERAEQLLPGLDVDFREVRVLWLRPGVLMQDVTIGTRGGFLAFDSVELRLAPFAPRRELVRTVQVSGGRARFSEDLERGLRRALESTAGTDMAEDAPLPIPQITLTDFRVDLELPNGRLVPLGQVDLLVEGGSEEARITGRLLRLPGTSGERALHIKGRVRRTGEVEVAASGIDLEVDSARLPPFWANGPGLIDRASGIVTLEAMGSVHLRGDGPTRIEASALLRDGAMETAISDTPIRDVTARIDLEYEPEPEDRLWTREAWDGLAELSASWNAQEVRAFARAGESAGDDAIRIWASIDSLQLAAEERGGLLLGEALDLLLDTMEFEGSAAVRVALGIPDLDLDEGEQLAPRIVLDVRPNEDAVVSYRGFENARGERVGIPIPCHVRSGRVLWALDPERERTQRVGLVGFAGDHGSGIVRLEGSIASPPRGSPPGTPALQDIVLRTPSIALDRVAAVGLAGMPATRDIWETYAPKGEGTVSTRWHFHSSPAVGGMTAQGDVRFSVDELAWKPMPVPVREAEGRLFVRWSHEVTPIEWSGPYRQRWRAYGIHLSGSGKLPAGGTMDAEISFRNEPLEAKSIGPDQTPAGGTHLHRVRVRGLDTKSEEFFVVARSQPVVGQVARELDPSGRVDVVYQGIGERAGEPYRFDVEVTPSGLTLQPPRFGLPIEDVRGRVVATGTLAFSGDEAEAPPEVDVTLRGAILAQAIVESRTDSSEFTVASTIRRKERAPVELSIVGVGIDPDARPVLRALRGAIGVEDPSAMGDVAITGRMDAELALDFVPGSFAPPAIAAHLDFRNNTLRASRFQLDAMRGSLIWADAVLVGEDLRAELANSPVELIGFRVFSSDRVDELASDDPLLTRRGFLPEAQVSVIQTGLRASDMALGRELLSHLFPPETVETLAERAELTGRLDLLDTQLVFFADGSGGLKIGVHGNVIPHSTHVRAGLPVQISSGKVTIDELLIEPEGTRARAHVDDLFARVAGRRLERASMIVSLVESRISVDDLSGTLEGGTISSLGGSGGGPALAIDLEEPFFFTTAMQLAGADANGLMQGLFETSIEDKGVVDGWARLSGTPTNVLGLRGMGQVELAEARLWSIPVLRALFSQLGSDGTGLFDEMDAEFRLEDGVLSMPRIDARSPILHLVGNGSIDLDGKLHHDLEVKYALVNRLGPLKVLLYWIQNSILRVAIRGTMWRPEIVLRNVFRDFFSGAPEHEPSLPLPGYSPLPERF